jgi:hypothetical protein
LFEFGETKLLLFNTKTQGCYLAMMKNNTKKLNARAIEVIITDHTSDILAGKSSIINPKIGIHFLDKQSYGHIQKLDASYHLYGNLDISIAWRDYL